MSDHFTVSRRTLIRGVVATSMAGMTLKLGSRSMAASDKQVTMGFIYVGPKDDFGYNQSHAQGKAGVSRLSWVKSLEEANVPETTAVEETMRNMIEQDGATVLFPTSYGYFDPYILKLAREFPQVQFLQPAIVYDPQKHPINVGSYRSFLIEPAYLAGIVAGYATKTGKLGFVVPKAIPIVLREVNSFTLGARSVKPDITVQAIFTGDWSLPVKEAEATNSLIDQNADVIISRVDNQKVVMSTAEKRGAFACGYHVNQSSVAPRGFLTGVEWDWTKFYTQYASSIQAGKTLMNGGIPHVLRGGLKEGYCKLSPFGGSVNAQAKQAVSIARAKLLDGTLAIFKGELKDNTGKVVIPAGKQYTLQSPELESMNWLVEGVEGNPNS